MLHLCTFKTPTSWAVMTEQGDADCAFQMRNGVKHPKARGQAFGLLISHKGNGF